MVSVGTNAKKRTHMRHEVQLTAHCLGEDFGEMHDSKWKFSAANKSFEMHQAGHVAGRQYLSARLEVVVDTVFSHHGGDSCFGDGEGAAEAAAFVFAGER
ncbi:MAG: hypothetical protein RLZZ458_646 [Planctomycetota bacterium]